MSQKTHSQTRRTKLSSAKQALLAKRLAATPDVPGIIRKRTNQNTYPLSFAQERLWFLAQLEPESPVYNRPLLLRLTGPLNISALEQTLDEIMRRHEVLRTTFSTVDGRPVQKIKSARSAHLPLINLSDTPMHDLDVKVSCVLAQEVKRPFDLRESIFHATLLRLGSEEHILAVVIHHIAFDAWSAQLFIKEMAACYEATSKEQPFSTPDLPIQVADFAQWQRDHLQGGKVEKHLTYWQNRLAEIEPLNLPTDHPRTVRQTYSAGQQSLILPIELVGSLQDLSQEEDATLFITLLTAFQVLLYRYTSQENITIGTPVAGRTHVETEGLIGCFLNMLVLRTDLSDTPTFRQLLSRVRQMTLKAYVHQELPFEKLVAQLQPERQPGRSPLFQVLFNLENLHDSAPIYQSAGLIIEEFEVDRSTAQFDLTLEIVPKNQALFCSFTYSTDLFEVDTIKRMAGHFQTLLEGIVANPSQPISDLPILTEAERHQLLVEWNDTAVAYPQDKCIHQLFEAQVERTPDAVALIFEDKQVTYQELNQQANQLAHFLIERGVEPETLIGICIERSIQMIIGLLGILKAGGAYVPLDPTYPQERLTFMVEDADVSILLTQQHLRKSLPPTAAQVIYLDSDWANIAQQNSQTPQSKVQSGNLAYIIYTSGSTGQPKGAMNSHTAIVNRLVGMQKQFQLTAQDRVLQKTPLSFDVSVWELFWPLTCGVTLVIAHPDGHKDLQYLIDTITKTKITTLYFNASILQLFIEAHNITQCTSLRRIFCGGEALPFDLMERTLSKLEIELHNLYGPTEAAIYASHWICTLDGQQQLVSIGRPVSNTQLYIVDGALQPVPIGVVGELLIGGIQVARGYYKRPTLTAEKFIANHLDSQNNSGRLYRTGDLCRYLPDGNIEFLGRIDNQIKIRGFRVELGEIEVMLVEYPQINQAAVVAHGDSPQNQRLIAYIVSNQEQPLTRSDIRRFLQQKLPDYMIPATFIFLDALPLTASEKVDRRALPMPDLSKPSLETRFIAPSTPMEEKVAAIWANLLRIERVGIHDNFFELGGHSLIATQVISRIYHRFQIELPLRHLFEKPTVAGLAEQIDTILWLMEPNILGATHEGEEGEL